MLTSHRTTARSTLLAFLIGGLLAGPAGAAVPETILFPVVGPAQFQDDFGDPRGSHRHQGNDIMAARGSPVVAVEAGRVRIYRGSSNAGCMLYFYGASGTVYYYIHLNDDLTKRDDNRATDCRKGVAYAANLQNDMRVRAGALIGYVGNSGDARGISPHLHFELHPGGRAARSPYPWLKRGPRLLYAVKPRTESTRLSLVGTVKEAEEGFALRVTQVYVASGWRGKPVPRTVTLGLDPKLVVQRLKDGSWVPAKLTGAKVGERVSVLTTTFKPTLKTQIPPAGLLLALRVRLRG